MDDVPPPEAFEVQPDASTTGARRVRRRIEVAVTLIVVASLVVLAAVEGSGLIIHSDTAETPASEAPRLAAVDAAGLLETITPRDGSRVPYPAAGVTFRFPAWSPDGSSIAAIGQSTDGTGVYVFAARSPGGPTPDPSVIYQSATQPPFYLYWTPDARSVTFLTTEVDGLALRIAPADGRAAASVVRTGAPMYWDFIDSDRLLVHAGPAGSEGFFGEVGSGGTPFAGTERSAGAFRSPAVSADGRFRAYLAAGDGAVGEVVRESRDGSGTTRIRVFGSAAVDFSPTSDELAFVAPDQLSATAVPLPIGPLRLLEPDGSEPRTILAGNVVGFFWSPTGDTIAALSLPSPYDTVTEARSTGRGQLTAATSGLELRLSFVAATDGAVRSERTVHVSDLFVNQVLPFFDQYALSHRFWSADGAVIALPITGDDDVTRLFSIPADGSEASPLAAAEMGSWSP
jgi:TolB protein